MAIRTARILFDWAGEDAVVGYTTKARNTTAKAVTDTAGASTGLTVNLGQVNDFVNNNTYAGGTIHGFTQAAIQETGLRTRVPSTVTLSGALSGEVIKSIKVWGATLGTTPADATTTYTIGSTTLTHIAANFGAEPPVSFAINSDTLPVVLNFDKAVGSIDGFLSIMEIELESVATASITSVDGDNTVVDGQQNVPVIVSGFAGDITSMSLRVGADTLALTGLTGTGDNYTIDLPDISSFVTDTVGLPLSSATYQNEIVATNGTDTAAINVTRNPKAGNAFVETVSAVATKGSIFETRTGGAPFDGSQIYYPIANNTTVSATGIIQTDATEFTAYVWDVTSKTWEVVTFNADSGGSSTYVKSIIRPIVKPIVKSILNN